MATIGLRSMPSLERLDIRGFGHDIAYRALLLINSYPSAHDMVIPEKFVTWSNTFLLVFKGVESVEKSCSQALPDSHLEGSPGEDDAFLYNPQPNRAMIP